MDLMDSDYGTNFNARVYDAAGTRAANTVLAAPSDSDGTARFRKLVAADLPSHTHNYAGSASAGGHANSSLSLFVNPSTRQTYGDYDLTSPTYAYKVIVVDPTTSGITDSEQALTYTEPKE